jgi:hypothetical protein
MPPVGFEPTISVLERAKTIHASYREATVIDIHEYYVDKLLGFCTLSIVYFLKIKER